MSVCVSRGMMKIRWVEVTPEAQAIKEKTDTLDFINIKSFCASMDTIKRVKRQPTEREKCLHVIYLTTG